MTINDVYATDLAQLTRLDPQQQTATWDVDTYFIGCLADIQDTIDWEGGGFIQNMASSFVVPKYAINPDTLVQYEQLTDGIPGEGDYIELKGLVRKVTSIKEHSDGGGWTFTLAGPDQRG